MRNPIVAALLASAFAASAWAQQPSVLPPHTNVAAYEVADSIEKMAYRSSPYVQELNEPWQQRQTDSSTVYSCSLTAEKEWKDYHIQLYARCARACRVSVNRRPVGYGDDSRQWNGFLLDRFLKFGKENTIEIEALKDSKGALLEDSRTPTGLLGTPYLLFKSDPSLSDYRLRADYDAASRSGTLTLEARVASDSKKGRCYLELEVWNPAGRRLDRMGRWMLFDGDQHATTEISRSWNDVMPWTAESPNLYTIVMRVYNEDMQEEEVTGTRFGFRRVEVKGGTLTVNNRPITLKGINYSIDDASGEPARRQMQHDIESMKRHHINAVRTTGNSPLDPFFYELCDRYGLYVVCDANLMPKSTRQTAVATDPDYIPLFEQRVRNLYETYKNHPSIIAWSLGNTRDNGVCMSAAYRQLKGLERHRPVVFAGAGFAETTDAVVVADPAATLIEKALAKSEGRPVLFSASSDALSSDQLASLWNLVARHRSFQGGFADQKGLSASWLASLAFIYRPADVGVEKIALDEGTFWVRNCNDFTDLSQYVLDYTVYSSLQSHVIDGELPLAASGGDRCQASLRIPPLSLAAGEELFVRFDVKRRPQPSASASADAVATSFVFPFPQKTRRRSSFANNGPALSPADTARLVLPQFHFADHTGWTAQTVARATHQPDSATLCSERMLLYSDHGRPVCDVHIVATLFSTGDEVVSYTVNPLLADQPAPQPVLTLGGEFYEVSWFGSAADNGSDSLLGFHSSTLSQPCAGDHVRWCTADQGSCNTFLHLLDGRFDLAASHKTVSLLPEQAGRFRLLFRPCVSGDPTASISVAYPEPASKIPAPPAIDAKESVFAQPMQVSITAPAATVVRFTLDGSIPSEESPVYTKPFTINGTTVVKARAFASDGTPSFTRTRKFNYNFIASTAFSRKANTPYNVGADTLLFDRRQGSVDNLSDGWLGFSGEAAAITVKLSQPIAVDYVKLRFAHAPDTWVLAPTQVAVAFSTDGTTFADTLVATPSFDPTSKDEAAPRVVELSVPVKKSGIRQILILPTTAPTLPDWHKAKGLKPWMLTDEVEVSELLRDNH